ncbi:MAG: selenide, water dikinase SelD [Bacteroidota bacterium]
MDIKLTAYSHGAGCGCKLSPAVLSEIIGEKQGQIFENLLIGNERKDDAAVYKLDEQTSIVSTTDFFMPIVDDPADFGAIAATNAISDIYAMGGTPLMAIAILGWPIDKLSTAVAAAVLEGGRQVCHNAGIPLAGGHSIDSPEPIFGLAVTGKIATAKVKSNSNAQQGDLLYLSKPLGVGLVTTAQKKGLATEEDLLLAKQTMLQLNTIGAEVANLDYVHGMTDVTGFGLAGHLLEIAEASDLSATIEQQKLPQLPFVKKYLQLGTSPGGTKRNWQSYGRRIDLQGSDDYRLIADPQTSGGLLMTVDPNAKETFEAFMAERGFSVAPFGEMTEKLAKELVVKA